MSLLNIWIANGVGHLMADAASYTDDGTVVLLDRKIVTFPGWRAVAAAIGRASALRVDYALKILDGLEEHNVGKMLAPAVRSLYEWNEVENPGGSNDVALAAVVWSDDLGGPVLWMCGSGGRCLMPGCQPFVAYSGTSGVGIVHPSLDDWSGYDWATLDPDTDGARLAEAQRQVQLQTPHNPVDFPVVGGFVDCATVTAEGVNLRRIVDWPADETGRRIAA